MQQDLTQGEDIRGDYALFVDVKHFIEDGFDIDEELKSHLRKNLSGDVFFRVIVDGEEQSGHGWLNADTQEVFQWG
jgi:hypothetical protein